MNGLSCCIFPLWKYSNFYNNYGQSKLKSISKRSPHQNDKEIGLFCTGSRYGLDILTIRPYPPPLYTAQQYFPGGPPLTDCECCKRRNRYLESCSLPPLLPAYTPLPVSPKGERIGCLPHRPISRFSGGHDPSILYSFFLPPSTVPDSKCQTRIWLRCRSNRKWHRRNGETASHGELWTLYIQ
jgi:hypothetical protein